MSCITLPAMLAACGAHATARESESSPNRQTTAFVGVNVLPMTAGAPVLPDQTVLVAEGRIVRLGARQEVPVPAGTPRIDGAGKFLIPGLADMHVHLEYFEDPSVLQLFLANGVTTVRNMDGRPYLLEWKRAVANGTLVGPSIYTAGPLLDGDPPILPDNTVIRSVAEAEAAVRAQAAAGYDFIKVYTNLPADAYRAVLRTAAEHGLPVTGHVPRRVDLGDALAGGQVAVEHLTDYGDWIEADDSPVRNGWHWSKLYLAMPVDTTKIDSAAVRIARSGVWTVPTMIQAHRALAPADSVREWLGAAAMRHIPADGRAQWEERLRRSTARMDAGDWALVSRGRVTRARLVRALHAAGAGLLIGTDSPNPFVLPGSAVLHELEQFVRAGIPAAEALAAATRDAARFSGDGDEWGTIEAGKRADLVLLNGNPLLDIRNVGNRAGVMVRGQWLPEAELQRMTSQIVVR